MIVIVRLFLTAVRKGTVIRRQAIIPVLGAKLTLLIPLFGAKYSAF
jgi:hypothetical protein